MVKKMKKKFFKQAKGAVSLFLIVIMLPFTEIASVLISAQRYNSSIALLDEIMNSSMLSTLGEYDGYVRDRFGLFSVNQKDELQNMFDSFFKDNIDGLTGNSFSDSLKATVTGSLALNDDNILKAHIREYTKFNAPVKMINDLFDISSLISNFEKSFNLQHVLDLANSGVDLCDGALEFGESYEKLIDLSDALQGLNSTYNSTYTEFSNAIGELYNVRDDIATLESSNSQISSELSSIYSELNELNDKLSKAQNDSEKKQIKEQIEKKEKEKEEKEKEQSDNQKETQKLQSKVQPLINTFNTKRDAYANSHIELANKLSEYKTEVKNALNKIESVINSTADVVTNTAKSISKASKDDASNKKDELSKELAAYENGKEKDDRYYELVFEIGDCNQTISDYDVTKGFADGLNSSVSEANSRVTEAKQNFDETVIQNKINELNKQEQTVRGLKANDVKNKQNGSSYHTTVDVVMNREQLENLYLYFEDATSDVSLSISDMWTAVKEFLSSIFKVKLVYDPALCANLDAEFFKNNYGITIDNPASNPLAALIQALGTLFKGLGEITTIATLNFKKAWQGLKDIFNGIKGVVTSIADIVTQIIANIRMYINEPSSLLLDYYFTQTLPCRTDYKSGKNMTGNSFSSIEYVDYSLSGLNVLPIISDIATLFTFALPAKEATDKMFCGAELEYLISGNSSEVANQSTVFFMLFVIRILFNLQAWTHAAELQALAAGPHYPIVFIIFLILESLIDCVLLVNDEKVSLMKSTPHLSSVGMTTLIPTLFEIVRQDGDSEASLRTKFGKIFNNDDKEGLATYKPPKQTSGEEYVENLMKLSYKEYLMFLMMLFSNHAAELKLFKNLIQVETLAYNTANQKGDFNISKAYTQITCEASGSATPLLSTMFSDTIFKFSRTQCRGY